MAPHCPTLGAPRGTRGVPRCSDRLLTQGGPHALAIELAGDALRAAFGPRWRVRVQLPVALDDESEPEPDLSVVHGTPREAGAAIPSRPVLIVEIAQSSLVFDRAAKASVYARAGIQDLWIVNLVNRLVEVHREPIRAADAPYGWRYGRVRSLAAGEAIAPLAAPRVPIAVDDLLP